MVVQKYDANQILLFVNCYHGLLAAREHYMGNCDVMLSNRDWNNIPEMRETVEGWAKHISDELGNMWVERPNEIKSQLLKKFDELEGIEG